MLLALMLILTITAVTDLRVGAAQSGDFLYDILGSGAYISGYTGPGGSVTIPDTVDGYVVTGMGDDAFTNCTLLTSITIPNSIRDISSGTFNGCTGLTSIAIPNSVWSIGYEAFSGCTGLTSINVGSSNLNYSSEDGILFNKTKTCVLMCPEGRTGSYTIPQSVNQIADYAFKSCRGLTSITIPNGLRLICGSAFFNCTSLTRIIIPSSVTSMGNDVFTNCTELTIYGQTGSLAQFCANRNGIPFIDYNTLTPSSAPTVVPTRSPAPTVVPTPVPTPTEVPIPSPMPITVSTAMPTATPTVKASATVTPTIMPTVAPTPTVNPTVTPVVKKSVGLSKVTPNKLTTKTIKITGVTKAKAKVKLVYGKKTIKTVTADKKGKFTINKLNLKKYKGKKLTLIALKTGYSNSTKDYAKIK